MLASSQSPPAWSFFLPPFLTSGDWWWLLLGLERVEGGEAGWERQYLAVIVPHVVASCFDRFPPCFFLSLLCGWHSLTGEASATLGTTFVFSSPKHIAICSLMGSHSPPGVSQGSGLRSCQAPPLLVVRC